MLQRSKSQRSPRRGAAPAKGAAVQASASETRGDEALGDGTGAEPTPDPVAEAVQSAVADVAATPDMPPATAPVPAIVQAEAADFSPGPGVTPVSDPVAGSGPAPVSDRPAGPGIAPVSDLPAGPGVAPVVETAPTGPAPAGEPNPAPAPSATLPVPPATRAPFMLGNTLMEKPMQQANKAAETMMKAAEEAAEFGRGNVEAITKATQIYFTGVQDLGKQTFAVVQGLADHAMEGAKALSGVKSLQEAVQIQSNYARAAIEKSVSESAKLGEASLKLTEQAFAPITARMTLAAEKITKVPVAA